MALDLEEQEQLDTVKRTLGHVTQPIWAALLLAVVVALLWWSYQHYLDNRRIEAGQAFDAFHLSAEKPGSPAYIQAFEHLTQRYPESGFSARAQLEEGARLWRLGSRQQAVERYRQVAQLAQEPALQARGRLALAAAHADLGQWQQALRWSAQPVAGYEVLFLDLAGDIYLASGQPAKALSSYEQALRHRPSPLLQRTIELKQLAAIRLGQKKD